MPTATYDAIVLGAGGVGSAAMWQLAKRGLRVLGIDRFHPPHDRGSSHGQTRIVRQAYFEHSDYVPLLLESYRLWEELESTTSRQLKRECGLLQVGPPDGAVVSGVRHAAERHALTIERLMPAEIEDRWPAFRVPSDLCGVFEPRGGYLHVELCVQSCLSAANKAGAELDTGVEVTGWRLFDDAIQVLTTVGEYWTQRLIIAAGAWAGEILADLGVQLTVRRKPLLWYPASANDMSVDSGFPCFLFELRHGAFYGFPAVEGSSVKVAEHSGGDPVNDPAAVDRTIRESDHVRVDDFLRSHLPHVTPQYNEHAVCLYTMSPDEHFIVDRHPRDERIVFAAGLSGHGFKFTPVLGRVLADLAVEERTDLPVSFLSLERFHR